MTFLLIKFAYGAKILILFQIALWVMGGLWVRLGKIKCAAKALACVLDCSSINFTKGWHFVFNFLFTCCRSCPSFRVSANGGGFAQMWIKFSFTFTTHQN
jgi:hypothetical protein